MPNGCMATSGTLLRWFQRELADLAASDYPFAASIFEMRRRGEYLSLPATAP